VGSSIRGRTGTVNIANWAAHTTVRTGPAVRQHDSEAAFPVEWQAAIGAWPMATQVARYEARDSVGYETKQKRVFTSANNAIRYKHPGKEAYKPEDRRKQHQSQDSPVCLGSLEFCRAWGHFSLQPEFLPPLGYASFRLCVHRNFVGPRTGEAFTRPFASGVHAHLRAVIRQARGMIQRIYWP
jgi:hypothetical protein